MTVYVTLALMLYSLVRHIYIYIYIYIYICINLLRERERWRGEKGNDRKRELHVDRCI